MVGEVDLFSLVREERPILPPWDAPVARYTTWVKPDPRITNVERLAWFLTGQVPLELESRDYGEAGRALRTWVRPPYDLAFFSHAEPLVALGSLVDAPVLVDFDDLVDRRTLTLLAATEGSRARSWLADIAVKAQGKRNAVLWSRLIRKVGALVDRVAVASALDRARLGLSNAVTIPNGYRAPDRPVGRIEVASPPTILFQGMLGYPPNRLAAIELVERILPPLRERVPDIRVRLVGGGGENVRHLDDPPTVTVTGWVDDITAELAKADLVVVPIRAGSGTRIKILEALAHRIPVVSTTIGAEGLNLQDDVHLLVADTPEEIADRCVAALKDPELRRRLADHGQQRFLARYREETVRRCVAEVATSVASREDAEAFLDGTCASPV
jgi:glycosyltransferase involved in cell wall biosynthesis